MSRKITMSNAIVIRPISVITALSMDIAQPHQVIFAAPDFLVVVQPAPGVAPEEVVSREFVEHEFRGPVCAHRSSA